jgi:hypothetical protein
MKNPTIKIADHVAEVQVLCVGVERIPDIIDLPRTSTLGLVKAGRIRTFKVGKRRLAELSTLREDMAIIRAESAA